jgi:cell division topological specificity factor MinE
LARGACHLGHHRFRECPRCPLHSEARGRPYPLPCPGHRIYYTNYSIFLSAGTPPPEGIARSIARCGSPSSLSPLPLRSTVMPPLRVLFAALYLLGGARSLVIGTSPLRTSGRVHVAAPLRSPAVQMGLMDWLGSMLYEKPTKRSSAAGADALSRLKVVLAHDRTGLDELTLGKIREEIQEVISKYVIIETADV